MPDPVDREAFASIYREHYPSVYRFALSRTGDRMRAGEVAQDVFVWLVHHFARFDPGRGSLGAFLGGVARKFLHRQQRNDRRWLPLDRRSPDGADFTARLEQDQQAALLRAAIAALPRCYRDAVVLCDLQGMSYQDAAVVLGCATGTVKSRLHRARQLLAAKLQRRKENFPR